jgi:hypothetical protein
MTLHIPDFPLEVNAALRKLAIDRKVTLKRLVVDLLTSATKEPKA